MLSKNVSPPKSEDFSNVGWREKQLLLFRRWGDLEGRKANKKRVKPSLYHKEPFRWKGYTIVVEALACPLGSSLLDSVSPSWSAMSGLWNLQWKTYFYEPAHEYHVTNWFGTMMIESYHTETSWLHINIWAVLLRLAFSINAIICWSGQSMSLSNSSTHFCWRGRLPLVFNFDVNSSETTLGLLASDPLPELRGQPMTKNFIFFYKWGSYSWGVGGFKYLEGLGMLAFVDFVASILEQEMFLKSLSWLSWLRLLQRRMTYLNKRKPKKKEDLMTQPASPSQRHKKWRKTLSPTNEEPVPPGNDDSWSNDSTPHRKHCQCRVLEQNLTEA